MALRWDEASVIVTCGRPGDLGEVGDDAVVIAIGRDEVDSPDALEAVTGWVAERTMSRRRAAGTLAYALPEPVLDDAGLDDEAAAAERALLENLREHERAYESFVLDQLEEGPMMGGSGAGVRFFVARVEELVVNN